MHAIPEDERHRIHSEYTAQSKDDILLYLGKQDVSVPARTGGRTPQHCERRTAFRLIATWAAENLLEYPLQITHQDKPDFLLCYQGHQIGVEVTEAVSEEWAATDALAEQMDKVVPLLQDQFKRGTPKRTAAQRRELLENQSHGPGWGDFGMDREWAASMMDCIFRKTRSLSRSGFTKCEKNLLLIYDNLPAFRLPRPQPIDYLIEELKPYFAEQLRYDGILIDSVGELLEFYPDGHQIHPIVDLWDQQKRPPDSAEFVD